MTHRNDSAERRGYQSLFFKLFIVLLGTVLLTYLAFGGFYRSYWNENAKIESHPNQVHYWGLVSAELGTPPDTLFAKRLSAELGIAIGIKGPSLNWHAKDFSEDVWDILGQTSAVDSVHLFFREGRLWASIQKGEYTFVYGSRRKPAVENLGRDWLVLLVFIFLAWLLGWFTLHRMLRPIRDLESGVQGVAAGNLDVRLTEKDNDELAALARSFNAMTASLKERLRARDQLLMDVSHELRSPLTRMRVALEMAEPGSAVDSLKEEVVALNAMVTEILETERAQSDLGGLKKHPENIAGLISEIASKFSGRTPGILWTQPHGFPAVPIDPERMKMVVRNLLDNAFKYGKTSPRPVEIYLRSENDTAVFTVRDFGPGIPEEDQRLVFEPFYRVDRSRSRSPGYGLGLPLCKRLVEAHGGTILLSSQNGHGTEVTVRLPLV
ncbi:MAG TPA: hypothetical protein DCQ83_04540 [Fibrobacteres bacterium]|nr:hypothetical protein [Fibrobacterota bacterium]